MKQVVQEVRSGLTIVKEVAAPLAGPGQVVVSAQASVVSAGTERYVVDLARKSLLGKARQRPDDVIRVLHKFRSEGLRATLTQVSAKLDEPMTLGYSMSGIVHSCGWDVHEFKPGDRVAVAAPHGEIVSAGRNLCAHIPGGVTFEQAAYTSIASIALQGVRLARVSLGDRVLVIGLGLIGQITIALLKAHGCRVFGTDIDAAKLARAQEFGADAVGLGQPAEAIKSFTGAIGVDAVILTTATASNDPIEFAAEAARPKARIVLIGTAGLDLPRPPFFKKELEFTVSSSLGPGRGDSTYEDKGIDYPIAYARWTAQRNMQAVLETMAAGKLPVEKLTTHRYPIERAAEAYDLIASREPYAGIVIEYPPPQTRPAVTISLRTAAPAGSLGVGMIGAGNFARLVMMPILSKSPDISWRGLCTAKGLHSDYSGRKLGFAFSTTDAGEIWTDAQTNAVFIATRHHLHAQFVIACLRAGKHVFVEKPLCIYPEELTAIAETIAELGDACPLLMVGFNRRFAPATDRARAFFESAAPLTVSYRFAPGYIPPESWTQDPEIGGGRIIGEACHAIDTCIALTGSVPIKVFAESLANPNSTETTDDSVFITMRHANGSISNISYQSAGAAAFPSERIEIFGAGKTAVIDAWNEIELWSGAHRKKLTAHKDKGHRSEFAAFLDACRQGGHWPIPWPQLYAATWASHAAVASLRTGMPVDAPETC